MSDSVAGPPVGRGSFRPRERRVRSPGQNVPTSREENPPLPMTLPWRSSDTDMTLRPILLVVVAISSTPALSRTKTPCHTEPIQNPDQGFIEVLDSPVLVQPGNSHKLRLVWRVRPRSAGDSAILYMKGRTEPLFTSSNTSKSFLDTGVTRSPNATYYAHYVRSNGSVVAKSNLIKKNDWMNCIRDKIASLTLNQVFFPGTHNSASYLLSSEEKSGPLSVFNSFVYNQDESVLDQLEGGARYLDLRIGYYPDEKTKGVWWTNHDLIKIHPLNIILDQIKSFINRSKEIVILDFHNFPIGFKDGNKVHEMFARHLRSELKEHMSPVDNLSWRKTLESVWGSGKRLVVSYNKPEIASKYGFFPPVRQLWSDSIEPEKLYSYLNLRMSRSWDRGGSDMRSAMAELTPNLVSMMADIHGGGLRRLADKVNVNVTLGLAGSCWGQRAQAVAVDFLSTTGVVSAAIRHNLWRGVTGVRKHVPDPPCDILNDLKLYHKRI